MERLSVSEALRQFLSEIGEPPSVLARRTGVSARAIQNFLAGGDIKLETFDALCEVAGLTLVYDGWGGVGDDDLENFDLIDGCS